MNEALIADPVRSRQILERIPAQRWGKPSDFEGAVVFLASQASDYVSGECLVVDGGWMGSECCDGYMTGFRADFVQDSFRANLERVWLLYEEGFIVHAFISGNCHVASRMCLVFHGSCSDTHYLLLKPCVTVRHALHGPLYEFAESKATRGACSRSLKFHSIF